MDLPPEGHRAAQDSDLYRQVVSSAREGVWLVSLDGRTLLANQPMADMLGVERHELLDSSAYDFYPDDQRERLAAALARRTAGVSEVVEDCFIRADGSVMWTIRSATPVYEGDDVVAALAMFTDVTEDRAAAEEQRLHSEILSEIREPVVAIQFDGTITYMNGAMRLLQMPPSVRVGANIYESDGIPARWVQVVRDAIETTRKTGSHRAEYAMRRGDGTPLTLMCSYRQCHDADGMPTGVVVVGFDTTELVAGRGLVAQRSLQHQAIARLSTLAIDRCTFGELCRHAAEIIVETMPADLAAVGQIAAGSYRQLATHGQQGIPAGDRVDISGFGAEVEQLAAGEPLMLDLSTLSDLPPGVPATGAVAIVPLRLGELTGLVSTWHSEPGVVTSGELDFLHAVANVLSAAAGRAHAESRLRHQALHDDLTCLPNRTLLLDVAVRSARRSSGKIAVMTCDVDNFGRVNEAFGHARGDELLVEIAARLSAAVRVTDTVARLGGNTFAVLCDDADAGEAAVVAERIIDQIGKTFQLNGESVFVSLSIGVAAPTRDEDPRELLRNAEGAMHEAKRLGGGKVAFFDDELFAAAVDRYALSADLRTAIAGGELCLHYQPQIDLRSGRVCDVEALVRWEHPRLGLLAPDKFLDIAAESGLLREIGVWVTQTALRDLAVWSANPATSELGVAINLSAVELADPMLVSTIARHLPQAGVRPERVTFEITETAAMRDPVAAAASLERLRALGVRIAVDDFGTGYSSMAYLRRLPLDCIKIDREFVDGVASPGDDEAIVRATIRLAGELRLETVAEGVETEAQAAALAVLGCDRGQGWLYARAMPLPELLSFMEARQTTSVGEQPSRRHAYVSGVVPYTQTSVPTGARSFCQM